LLHMASGKDLYCVALFLLTLSVLPCAAQAPRSASQGSIVPLPKAALRVDCRPISIGLSSGGFGLALGGELALGFSYSIITEVQYMNLADAQASLLTLHIGPRAYLGRLGIGGLFAGAYALGLSGGGTLPEVSLLLQRRSP
jgi:hypothetical protein